MKLWGGRFEEGPSEVFERFSGSLDFDRRLIEADIQGSQAFARALESVGIVTATERAELVAAFDAILADARKPEFYDGCNDEDVHTLVIRKLKDRVGALSEKIHTGRSRNEQVSLDVRLWLRREIDRAAALLAALMQALEIAREHFEVREQIVRPQDRLRAAQVRIPGNHRRWIAPCAVEHGAHEPREQLERAVDLAAQP